MPEIRSVKSNTLQKGKEQITKVDKDEKMVTAKPDAEKTEAPKKKKILFVYIMHRMPVTVVKTDQNVPEQIKKRPQKLLRSRRQQLLRQPENL